jgi:mono/diheme cytochrome c family protein
MRRPRNRTSPEGRAVLLAVVVLLAPACSGTGPAGTTAQSQESAGPPAALATKSERAGEEVFRRENCGRCHTLFDRPPPTGDVNLPSGPAVDLLDSRVGPDLGLEGHRRSDDWHYAHLYSPGVLVPGSRMPASRHLFRPVAGRPVPTPEGRDLVAYLQALGRAQRDVWAEWRRREPDIPALPPVDGALVRRGAELYGRHCHPCHGGEGDGRGELAGFFTFPPRDLVAGRYRFKSTPAGRPPEDVDLFRTITLGAGTGAAMPAFYWLAGSDRWALVLVVKEFSPSLRGTGLRARPAAARTEEGNRAASGRADDTSLRDGRRAWDSLGCASCHGSTGEGMTPREAHTRWSDGAGEEIPRSGDLTHACALRGGASGLAIERALMFGVGESMPSYADALADGPTRRALVSFVLSLDTTRPPDRSGPQAGSISPRTPGRP